MLPKTTPEAIAAIADPKGYYDQRYAKGYMQDSMTCSKPAGCSLSGRSWVQYRRNAQSPDRFSTTVAARGDTSAYSRSSFQRLS